MTIVFENIIPLGFSYFSFMFATGVGIGFVILGIIALYFGMKKTKKIGIITGVFGMFILITILNVIKPPDNWVEIGIISTAGAVVGSVSSCFVIFIVLSRMKNKNKVYKNDDFEDIDLEKELKILEREMNEGVEDERNI
tara:strand:+ start:234 stop:650 length:417 start_codon:yes stop_codon:yes gene_type:complete